MNYILIFVLIKNANGVIIMSKECAVTGKKPISGNNVSHSHKKTRRRFLPNLQKKRIYDTETGEWVTLKISAKGLKIIDKIGLKAALEKGHVVK